MAIPKVQREELIKGRKVRTEFKPVTEKEGKAKREAITQVIFKSMRRLKGEK